MLRNLMNDRFSTTRALLRRSLSHLGIDAERLLTALLALALLAQFLPLVHAVGRNADSWPVINAQDNDAAFAIRTAERSGWLRDNRFYPYGNLYFNLAHTLAAFDPSVPRGSASLSLENDRAHHFGLMAVSLLSLYGIAFVAAFFLTRSRPSYSVGTCMKLFTSCCLRWQKVSAGWWWLTTPNGVMKAPWQCFRTWWSGAFSTTMVCC